jgi:hypothetical protein
MDLFVNFSLAASDTSRRRVQLHTTEARSSNCGTLKIEKMNSRRGVLIKLIMFPSITRRRWLWEEHNPVLSDDRPY